ALAPEDNDLARLQLAVGSLLWLGTTQQLGQLADRSALHAGLATQGLELRTRAERCAQCGGECRAGAGLEADGQGGARVQGARARRCDRQLQPAPADALAQAQVEDRGVVDRIGV